MCPSVALRAGLCHARAMAEVLVTSVVFDVGGVLLDHDPRRVYRDLIPDAAELEWFLSAVCTPEWNASLDAGRPFDEACSELAGRYPAYAESIYAWKRQDEMVAGEIPGAAAAVRCLRAAGVPLYLLTNMPADVFDARQRRYEVLRLFHGAIVSGRERMLKPEAAIFELLSSRFGLDLSKTLFIDDKQENVDGARAVGLVAERFTGAGPLLKALHEHGLPV